MGNKPLPFQDDQLFNDRTYAEDILAVLREYADDWVTVEAIVKLTGLEEDYVFLALVQARKEDLVEQADTSRFRVKGNGS